MRSIATRLLVGNAIVLAVFVVLTALAVSWSVHRRAETARLERLQGLVYGILGATELTDGSSLSVDDGALPDPTLAEPVAGLYAELVDNTGARIWQSRSSVRHVPPVLATPIGEWTFERLGPAAGRPALDRLQLQSAWELEGGEELPFVVHVVDERGSLGRELGRFDRTLRATLLGIAAVLLGVQALVLRRGLAPLGRIGAEVRAVERGERDALSADVPHELAPLAGALNALLASERGRRQRYRDLLDDLAHTLKTPLSILANLGRTNEPSPATRTTLAEQTGRMRASIERSLERASRQGSVVLAPPLAVRPVVERLARSLEKLYPTRESGVGTSRAPRFEIDVDPALHVRVADADLHELLGNVMENACKFGASTVRVTSVGSAADEALVVDDDGPGFPADLERLARRGERADTRIAGQGLGLAASRELMEAHGGTLALGASPAGGARVTLAFGAPRFETP